MAIHRIIRIFRSGYEFASIKPDEVWPDTCSKPEQYQHQKTIVSAGKIGLLAGLLFGAFAAVEMYLHPRHPTFEADDISKVALTPFLGAVGGTFSGACWAGVFAPDSFLQSPIGVYWASLIRAKSPGTARAKSLIIAACSTGFFVAFLICLYLDKV